MGAKKHIRGRGARRRRGPGAVAAAAALAVCLVGLLLWSKLRLVADVPRQAWAEPQGQGADPEPGPDGRAGSAEGAAGRAADEPAGL